MRNANLIILNKSYINDEAIENTIRYIFRLDNPHKFYYGTYPPSLENAIALFHQVREVFPQYTCDQQIQHLVISFGGVKDVRLINEFSNQIASLFSQFYPVCFALHDDEKHLHTHFIISTTSYIRNTIPLTSKVLNHTFLPLMEQAAAVYQISLRKVTKNV